MPRPSKFSSVPFVPFGFCRPLPAIGVLSGLIVEVQEDEDALCSHYVV